MSYTFKDASGTTQTAAAATVASQLQPIVQINSALGAIPVSLSGNSSISGAIQIAGFNPTSITTVKQLGTQVVSTDQGLVTNTVMHGLTSAGGGSYVDVKVDPSGALVTTAGSIIAFQGGTWATSIVGVPQPHSVSGVGLFNVNHIGNGSILAIPTSSTIAVIQASSIAGTYTEDSAHATNDRGLFTLNVRNDTMSSITSADGDYTPAVTGPIGEVITANSPITKWYSAQSSVMYGTSVQVVAAGGASVFNYLSGLQVANDSGTFSRVKITGGLGSVLAWTVAPASGGSNIIFTNPIKVGENSGISASISGVSSVYISMQGFTSKT